MITLILAVVGLLLSLYAYYTEYRHEKDKNYKAVCDLSDTVSCTKAFSSPYGKIMGISNAVLGMLFYIAVIVLVMLKQDFLVFLAAIAGVLSSIYLAYLLYFKVRSYCVVCTSIYIINILLLVFSYLQI